MSWETDGEETGVDGMGEGCFVSFDGYSALILRRWIGGSH